MDANNLELSSKEPISIDKKSITPQKNKGDRYNRLSEVALGGKPKKALEIEIPDFDH
jgi:hypothetical protein